MSSVVILLYLASGLVKFGVLPCYVGHAVALLVEALRYKSEGRGFNSRWCHFSVT